jgi:hypothetical protein
MAILVRENEDLKCADGNLTWITHPSGHGWTLMAQPGTKTLQIADTETAIQ